MVTNRWGYYKLGNRYRRGYFWNYIRYAFCKWLWRSCKNFSHHRNRITCSTICHNRFCYTLPGLITNLQCNQHIRSNLQLDFPFGMGTNRWWYFKLGNSHRGRHFWKCNSHPFKCLWKRNSKNIGYHCKCYTGSTIHNNRICYTLSRHITNLQCNQRSRSNLQLDFPFGMDTNRRRYYKLGNSNGGRHFWKCNRYAF